GANSGGSEGNGSEIIDERRNLRLEFGNADESRATRAANSRGPGQSSTTHWWRLQSFRHIARNTRRGCTNHCDICSDCSEEVVAVFAAANTGTSNQALGTSASTTDNRSA